MLHIGTYRFARPLLKLSQQDISGCFCHQEIPFSGYSGLLIYFEFLLISILHGRLILRII